MKQLLCLALIAIAPTLRADITVDLASVRGPDHAFNDPVMGVSLVYPESWEVIQGRRWGENNSENTFWFRTGSRSAQPAIYYQRFSPRHPAPSPTDTETYFRTEAAKKEASRRDMLPDYANVPSSFTFRTIGGHPGFSYFAIMPIGQLPLVEYVVRIVGPTSYAMIFTRCTREEFDAVRAEVDRMAETVRLQ